MPSCSSSRVSSSLSSVSFSQMKRPARTTSGMTTSAASVTPRAVATIFRAFIARTSFAGTPGPLGPSGLGCLRDQRLDIVLRELGEHVMGTSGPHLVKADHERALLLEEEDVAGLLLVDPLADDAEGLLIVARGPIGPPRGPTRKDFS